MIFLLSQTIPLGKYQMSEEGTQSTMINMYDDIARIAKLTGFHESAVKDVYMSIGDKGLTIDILNVSSCHHIDPRILTKAVAAGKAQSNCEDIRKAINENRWYKKFYLHIKKIFKRKSGSQEEAQ